MSCLNHATFTQLGEKKLKMGNTIRKPKDKEDKGKKAMVERDQELNQCFVDKYFYTEYGHKNVGRPTNLILKVFLEGLYDKDCPCPDCGEGT